MPNPKIDPAFAGTANGDKIYFRVIAATSGTFTSKSDFQGVGNYANLNDPCKNYSVSTAIEATVNCPKCNPILLADLPLTISTTPTSGNLCPGETATLLSKTLFRSLSLCMICEIDLPSTYSMIIK